MLTHPDRPPTPREAALARMIMATGKALGVVAVVWFYGRGWWVFWHYDKSRLPDTWMELFDFANALLTELVSLGLVIVLGAGVCDLGVRAYCWLVWATTTKPREFDEWGEL